MKLKIAGLQTVGHPGDVAANLQQLDATARSATASGADLLVTPELFITGYDIGELVLDLARQDLLSPVQAIAKANRIAVVVGLPEEADGRVYNTIYFVDDLGRIAGRHRKAHLFGELDRRYFTAGDHAVSVVSYRGVNVAMMICYDVEFPETVRMAALGGAHLVVVPTAQMEPFAFVAEHLVRTRAWENQVYVAYVNHDGKEGDTVYVGGSSIVAPNGDVLASVDTGEGLIFATIDTEIVVAAQRANPYLEDLRPSLNSSLLGDAAPRSD